MKSHTEKTFPLPDIYVGYLLLVTNFLMPLFSEDISQRFMIEKFGHFAEGREASTVDILAGMVSDPLRLLGEIFTPFDRKLNYLIAHWLPLAFLAAISLPAWICSAFPLLQLFLQSGDERFAIFVRYAVAVVPSLFFGMVIWWSARQHLFQAKLKRFWQGCLVVSLISIALANPHQALFFLIPDSIDPWVYQSLPRQWHHVHEVTSLLDGVAPTDSVSTTRFLIPRLSGRRTILLFPNLKYRDDGGRETVADRVVADMWQLQQRSELKKERLRFRYMVLEVENLLKNPEYGLVDIRDGVVLFQKGIKADEEALKTWLTYRADVDSIVQRSLKEGEG